MNYINPHIFFEDIEDEIDDYICMSHQINMITKDGIYVNILSVENLNPNKKELLKLNNNSILVETPEEIIAKKIIFRKNDNKVRDLFDIAYAINNESYFLDRLLKINYITKKDLKELYEAIKKVNEKDIDKELEIISPFKKINNILSVIEKGINKCNF
jgi:predicted nucleotidyltransferase component of viral defense system